MLNRKKFIKALALGGLVPFRKFTFLTPAKKAEGPVVISTWRHGVDANKEAWKILAQNGSALDAVEAGVRITEADPTGRSVGIGGLPDREGNVTLDACIMDENMQCGSVAFLQHILHPVSVARKIKEETPHVMLVGDGALDFALEHGFEKHNLLTPEAKEAWKKWLKKSKYQPEINVENHDTIGMLALDSNGNLSGACTTSGTAFKMYGRVGDSPLIGAGLYVDNEVGAAAATGLGEEIIRVCGSHLVVENMRRGDDPRTACKNAVQRIVNTGDTIEGKQVGFIALNKAGQYGGYAVRAGFDFAVHNGNINILKDAKHSI
jgi:isoaspartyl peptidase/L-asparaginase-like protein (Ntn-hydrolase superfamily)